MNLIRKIRLIGLLVLAIPATGAAAEQWDLSGVQVIDLDGVSGDVVVRSGGGQGRVELEQDVYPADSFEVRVDRDGSTLSIGEIWRNSSSGRVVWTIELPSGGTELRIHTASGSLEARDVDLQLDFQSASGDIKLENVELGPESSLSTASGDYKIRDMTVREGVRFRTASGDIKLENVEIGEGVTFSSASGNVSAEDCRGHLSFKSASGDVVVKDSTLLGEGKFSSASGDVSLYLDGVPGEGLSASSASGKVLLDAGDLAGDYTLVLVADVKKGRIECPFDVTSERVFRKNRRDYEERIFQRGSGGPEISLETASGAVIVRD